MTYFEGQAHAKLSASGADRWFLCPPSVFVEEGYGDESNIHAEQGTIAHELADLCLKNEMDAVEYVGRFITVNGVGIYGAEHPDRCQLITPADNHRDEVWRIEIDDEMSDNVQLYLDYVRSYREIGSILMPERRVSFAHIVPEGFGTSDALMLHPRRRHLDIFDLKYGIIPVRAKGNRQGRMYAIGALWEFGFLYEFDTITIHIIQPRLDDRYSEWHLTRADIEAFAEEAKAAAEYALSGQGQRTAGEKQCMWCKARHDCPALKEYVEGVIGAEFDDLTELSNDTLTDEDRQRIITNKAFIERFLRDVYDHCEHLMLGGAHIEGFKVVRSRTNRKLNANGEKYLKHHLGQDAYKPKALIGITDAEKKIRKKLGKTAFNEAHEKYTLYDKPEGRLTMTTIDDSRPAVAVEVFEDETLTDGL